MILQGLRRVAFNLFRLVIGCIGKPGLFDRLLVTSGLRYQWSSRSGSTEARRMVGWEKEVRQWKTISFIFPSSPPHGLTSHFYDMRVMKTSEKNYVLDWKWIKRKHRPAELCFILSSVTVQSLKTERSTTETINLGDRLKTEAWPTKSFEYLLSEQWQIIIKIVSHFFLLNWALASSD